MTSSQTSPVADATAAADERATHEARRQLAAGFQAAPVGVAVTTDDGVLVQANPALGRLLGLPAQQLLGRRLEELTAPEDLQAVRAARSLLLREQADVQLQVRLAHPAGPLVPVTLTCALAAGVQPGHCDYLVVSVHDSTDRRATEAELVHRTLHDPLTGLPNRVLLHDRLDRALARLPRSGSGVAVLFADLDGFKTVNDRWGHSAGDHVLCVVARRLAGALRPGDTACRYGGDEFVVLCQDSGQAEADSVARRIHAALSVPIRFTTTARHDPDLQLHIDLTLTASIGIAATDDPQLPGHSLMQQADSRMYQVKDRARPGQPQSVAVLGGP